MFLKYFRSGAIFCFLFSITFSVCGQNQPASEAQINKPNSGLWTGLYTKLRLSDRVFYYAETHYRRKSSLDNRMDFVGSMSQVYNRHGATYLFNKYFEITAGPVVVLNYGPRDNPNFNRMVLEYRFWHQWLFIMPQMGRTKIYHQFRFEHRSKKNNDVGASYQYTDRYRYKIFAYIPLNSSYIGDKTWFLSPSAEIFMHSGKSIVYNPFEDFRVYTGLGYIFNKNFMFFGGHMWTIGQTSRGFQYRQNHIIRLNLYVNFDLRSPQKTIPKIHLAD
jgi:hypothetical protein